MQNTTLFQLVLCVVQAQILLFLPMLCWLFGYVSGTQQQRPPCAETAKFSEKTKKGTRPELSSFRVTAVTLCDGLTVTLQHNRPVTSISGRQQPVTRRPSHPVTPVTGPGESVSPTIQSSFAQFPSHFLHLQCTTRTRKTAGLAYKQVQRRVKKGGKKFRKHQTYRNKFFFVICITF